MRPQHRRQRGALGAERRTNHLVGRLVGHQQRKRRRRRRDRGAAEEALDVVAEVIGPQLGGEIFAAGLFRGDGAAPGDAGLAGDGQQAQRHINIKVAASPLTRGD